MNEEMLFRIVFWLLLFIVILFNRLIPAIRSRKNKEKILPNNQAIHNEGKVLFFLRIILGIPFFGFLICYSIYPPFMNLLHLNIALWLRWIGAIVAFIGVVFWVYSQAILDRNWSPQLQIQAEHKLIKRGPYKAMRHPLYTSMFIWVIGLAILTANWGFVVFAVLTIIALIARVPKEEKMMIEQFGDEYRKYLSETGRFLPKLMKK
jgi:protein-S-isoprenylcysteine O-methyltransferase Ste14